MSERFKKSRYNHFVQSKEGKRLAFNAMSCGLAEMDDDSYRRFELLSDGGKDSINDDGELLKNLKLGGFLVSENVDELDILRAGHYKMRFGNKGFGLTIIPTFNCNFLNVALLLTIVTLVFDIPLGINIGGALLAIVLTITSLSGIGLMSAGIIIITKVGDPITWAFTTLTGLLSGVLFPVEYLPNYLQTVSMILPTTHALHALRMTLIQNAGISEIMPQLTLLFVMTLITVPLGFIVIRLGFNQARRVGSLAQY